MNEKSWTGKKKLSACCRSAEFWEKASFAIIGDSITELGVYQRLLNEKMRFAELYVDGVSGSTVSWAGYRPFVFRTRDIPESTDFVFLLGGTNDFHIDLPLGEKESSDPMTFRGAVAKICDDIGERLPKATVIFATPLQRTLLAVCNHPDETNLLGLKFDAYANAITEVCDEKGAVVMDLFRCGEITKEKCDRYLADGVHPNEEGFAVLADDIAAFLTDMGCMLPEK